MSKLEQLVLADCNIGDRALIQIIQNLDEFCRIDVLDLSGNQLGKSALFTELATKIDKFLLNS